MTYRELLEELKSANEEQLNCNVTVWFKHKDEFYPIEDIDSITLSDVLDQGHLILVHNEFDHK